MKEPASWRTIDSSVAFDGGWVKVRADECITADGRSVSPYYILESPDYVHVAALTPERELVMVRQYRQGSRRAHLELPAGIIEAHDVDAVAAARRELREETGYVADDWRLLHVWEANPARMANRQHLVLATGARRLGDPDTDGVESLTSGLMTLAEASAAVLDGRIDTTLHIASILRVLLELER
jgi:8-oxo-dGTP pyrophosphatase MutT (NUDIX family)